MPSARTKRAPKSGDDEAVDRAMPRVFLLQALGWNHRDAVACIAGTAAAVVIMVNGLFLQPGPHPAPMLKSGLMQTASITTPDNTALPRARPPELASTTTEPAPPPAAASAPRSATEIIADIQRELARHGFYDAGVDGRHGPKTDAAVRDFEHAAGLKPSIDLNEALLRAIRASSVRGSKRPAAHSGVPHKDPIADLLTISGGTPPEPDASDRVRGVQRALTDYGYGQIDPTGVVDSDTQAAIAKFERARSLPVTGQVSERVARELASITGRPLE